LGVPQKHQHINIYQASKSGFSAGCFQEGDQQEMGCVKWENDWIGLREYLQETIDFPIKYGAFL
jgi:hypothetical protein